MKSGNPFCTPIMFIRVQMNFLRSSVQESLEHQRTRKENLKSTLRQNLKEYESRIDQTLEAILSSKEIELHRDSVDYKQLRRNFVRVHNLRLKWSENLLENRVVRFRLRSRSKDSARHKILWEK